ncbi:MAG: hypothetical protein QNJ90_00830 [Planctomycetota bacterium]|nr:hypothetical protein [Planctomycetota bacterium]
MKWRKSTGLVPSAPTRGPTAPGTLARVSEHGIVPTTVPEERTADAYLRLSAHLLLESERRNVHTIGVLSAVPGEGKTTAAINLVACLGRARGRRGRALLVDGDGRRRTLSRLMADGREGPRTKPMLVATSFENVDFLSAPAPESGPTIHTPSAWTETLTALAARYPQVVVDCPSVLEDPEGVVLRECVDALVVVVRAGSTTRGMLRRAIGRAADRVAGVIVNGARTSRVAPVGATL